MVTCIPGSWLNGYSGKSTDDKPLANVPDSSFFYEMDTTDCYMFDAANASWMKQAGNGLALFLQLFRGKRGINTWG